eukprot:CAMPEP_0177686004 /NCGR_PEP_ID=MMETSP0447-20121125/33331_1 /TAXON_ID=0 /ORGANISM="Stygamoeba regulata, Strain BSH-02190019" /LENGTH=98 /DNA_ID=CAMNT_0019196085 /DNA_START=246 /DNA_END=542 /DNA_ORIENTATION=+
MKLTLEHVLSPCHVSKAVCAPALLHAMKLNAARIAAAQQLIMQLGRELKRNHMAVQFLTGDSLRGPPCRRIAFLVEVADNISAVLEGLRSSVGVNCCE